MKSKKIKLTLTSLMLLTFTIAIMTGCGKKELNEETTDTVMEIDGKKFNTKVDSEGNAMLEIPEDADVEGDPQK